MDNQLDSSAYTLRDEIKESVMKFITETGKVPGLSIEVHETEIHTGKLTSVKVDIVITL